MMAMYKLDDICDVRDGTHDSPQYVPDGYPLVTSKNIIDGQIDISNVSLISEEDYKEINRRSKVDNGDILMPMIGTIGKPIIVNKKFEFAIKNVALIKFTKGSKVTPTYLRYILDSNLFKRYVEKENRGGTQKFISLGNIRNFPVPVVSLDKQNEITSILDKFSQLIRKRKAQIELLDQLIKSRFVEMFGDVETNPKCWLLGKINDIGKCVAGATPSTVVPEYWENGTIPWMSSGEVNKKRIYQTDAFITQKGYNNSSTKLVPAHTVVLAMAGQGRTRGTPAIVEISLCTNQSICSIVNNEKVNTEYLYVYLTTQYEKLRSASNGDGGRGGLNLQIIGNYPILIPPIELQNQFAKFVEKTDKLKFSIQQSLDETQKLFDSLMQEYFG